MREMEIRNPSHPGWLHLLPLIDHLEQRDYDLALQEARKFRSPGLAWDPLLRASIAALAAKERLAAGAYRELADLFPEVEEDPSTYIGKYLHFDRHREPILSGLAQARRTAGSSR
jgi:hypothetical protein